MCRSWSLLQDCRDAKADLVLRLSTRLAKALCHGVRAGTITRKIIDAYETAISQLRHAATERLAKVTNVPAIDDLTRSWEEWDVTQAEYNEGSQNADDCLNRWARLPLFCKPLYVPISFVCSVPLPCPTCSPVTQRPYQGIFPGASARTCCG